MPTVLLGVFLLFVTVITGSLHLDSAQFGEQRTWLQDQIDQAVHHASLVPIDPNANQGRVEIDLPQAKQRFIQRLRENAGYSFDEGISSLLPGANSLTKKPVAVHLVSLSATEATQSWRIVYQFDGTSWVEQARERQGGGGRLEIVVKNSEGDEWTLPPKFLHGPSLIAIAYADDPSLSRYTGPHRFPIVSVQEVKG